MYAVLITPTPLHVPTHRTLAETSVGSLSASSSRAFTLTLSLTDSTLLLAFRRNDILARTHARKRAWFAPRMHAPYHDRRGSGGGSIAALLGVVLLATLLLLSHIPLSRARSLGQSFMSVPSPGSTIAITPTSPGTVSVTNNHGNLLYAPVSVTGSSWISANVAALSLAPRQTQSVLLSCVPDSSATSASAVLTIDTSSFSVACTSPGPTFSATPSASSTVSLNVSATIGGGQATASILVTNLGYSGTLTVSRSNTPPMGSWFSVSNLPANLTSTQQATVAITCSPPAAATGQQTERLDLATNDATNTLVTFTMTCSTLPTFGSLPAPGSLLTFPLVSSWLSPALQSISISNLGIGLLSVSFSSLSGSSWFSIASGLPIGGLSNGGATIVVSVSCGPPHGATGSQSAQLSLSTNDPLVPKVTYSLLCSVAPGFSSSPVPSSTLAFGSVASPTAKSIVVVNVGLGFLTVDLVSISPSSWFSVSSGLPIAGLSNSTTGGATISIVCSPPLSALTPMTGSLVLSTSDSSHPSVSYSLSCSPQSTFVSAPPPYSLLVVPPFSSSVGYTTITVRNGGFGGLSVSESGGGFHGGSWFKVSSGLPIHNLINNGTAMSTSIIVSCTPDKSTTSDVDTLTLTTSDPLAPTVSYMFNCSSTPQLALQPSDIGSTLAFLSTGPPTTIQATILNQGNGELFLDLEYNQTGWFQIGGNPDKVDPGKSKNFNIKCQPPMGSTGMQFVDTLTIVSNDPINPIATLTLVCTSSTFFWSQPPVGSTINFGSVTTSATRFLNVSNAGFGTMAVSAAVSLAPSSWFSIVSGLPISNLTGTATSVVTLECQPPVNATGNSTAVLQLSATGQATNAEPITFNLFCDTAPSYSSLPEVGETLSIKVSSPSVPSNASIMIYNSALGLLSVTPSSSFAISSWFSISSGLPITSLSSAAGATSLVIQCRPPSNAAGTYTETLLLTTNDATLPSVSYTLSCQALPSLSSTPTAGSILLFSSVSSSSSSSSRTISISNAGLSLLSVSLMSLTPSWFSIASGLPIVSLPNVAPASSIVIVCSPPPSATGTNIATLVLSSNDPTQSMGASFTLSCQAVPKANLTADSGSTSFPAVSSSLVPQTLSFSLSNIGLDQLSVSTFMITSMTMPSWFSIVSGLPLGSTLSNGQSATIVLQCQPPPGSTGSSIASFMVSVNDPSVPVISLSLTCHTVTHLVSVPAPSSMTALVLPAVSLSPFSTSSSISVAVGANGFGPLNLAQSGSFRAGSWFSIVSGLPLSGGPSLGPFAITITCCPPPGASGSSNDTLTISTNDPTQPIVSYLLSCTANSRFSSTPSVGTSIALGYPNPPSATIAIANLGIAPLIVSSAVFASMDQWLSVSPSSSLPSTLSTGDTFNLIIMCSFVPPYTPATHSQTLVISTNDPLEATASFSVSCVANPIFSTPSQTISIAAELNTMTSTNMTLVNSGPVAMSISALTDLSATIFSISLPPSIAANDSLMVVVTCMATASLPSQTVVYKISTTDPANLEVTFTLVCAGGPVYSSDPAPGGTITITPSSPVVPATQRITISNEGLAPLTVTAWLSPAAAGLTISSAPMSAIPIGSSDFITISCSSSITTNSNLLINTTDTVNEMVTFTIDCIPMPIISVSPNGTVTFDPVGSVLVPSTQPFTLQNTGLSSLSGSISVSIDSWFVPSITSFSNVSPSMIVSFSVSCQPPLTAIGTFVDTLSLTNDVTGATTLVSLSCTSVAHFSPSISPSSGLMFASVSSTSTQQLQVSNDGFDLLSVSQVGSFESDSWFSINNLPIVGLSRSDAAATISITCAPRPSSIGSSSTSLVLSTNDPTQPSVMYLLTCTSAPAYSSTPSPGSTIEISSVWSSMVQPMALTIENAAFDFLNVTQPSFSTDSWFSIDNWPTASASHVAPGSSISIDIRCTPSNNASWSMPEIETMTIVSNTSPSMFSYTLQCTAAPRMSTSPASGSMLPEMSPTLSTSIIITNIGFDELEIDVAALSAGTWFSVSLSSGMGSTASIARNSSMTVSITCSAPSSTVTGSYDETLWLSSNDPQSPSASFSLACLVPGPMAVVSPPPTTSISFGSVAVGTSRSLALTLDNGGYGLLQVSQSASAGLSSGWFSVTSGLPLAIDSSHNATVVVRCSPPSNTSFSVASSIVTMSDSLVLTTTDSTQPTLTWPLSCSSGIVLSPDQENLSFPIVSGQSINSTSVQVNVSNPSSSDVILQPSITSSSSSNVFEIESPATGAVTVPANGGSQISIVVRCSPTTDGVYTASLVMADGVVSGVVYGTYQLTCSALLEELALSPANTTITAPPSAQFTFSDPIQLQITNIGASAVLLSVFQSDDVQPQTPQLATFSHTTGSLMPGAQSTIEISCMSMVIGQSIGHVTILGGASNHTVTVLCTGTPVFELLPDSNDTLDFGDVPLSSPSIPIVKYLQLSSLSTKWLTLEFSIGQQQQGRRREIETTTAQVGVSPNSWFLAPMGALQLAVSVQATAIGAGEAGLFVSLPGVTSPILLRTVSWVSSAPRIQLPSPTVSFGDAATNATTELELRIGNSGNTDLLVSSVSMSSDSGDVLMIMPATSGGMVIAVAGGSLDVSIATIACTPKVVGITYRASVSVASSDPDNGVVVIPVLCIGTASCFDKVQNQGEVGVDCGGPCAPCAGAAGVMLAAPQGALELGASVPPPKVTADVLTPAPASPVGPPTMSPPLNAPMFASPLPTMVLAMSGGSHGGSDNNETTVVTVVDPNNAHAIVATLLLPPLVDATQISVGNPSPKMVSATNINDPVSIASSVIEIQYNNGSNSGSQMVRNLLIDK